jgi:hypothetical protein
MIFICAFIFNSSLSLSLLRWVGDGFGGALLTGGMILQAVTALLSNYLSQTWCSNFLGPQNYEPVWYSGSSFFSMCFSLENTLK